MPYPSVVNRERIVTKALEMVDRGGSPTLQHLAEMLGIRAPSLYRYFDSRERLLAAVGLAGFARLADFIRRATRHAPSLEASAWAMRRFAGKHQALYRLMNETDARLEDQTEATAVAMDVIRASLGPELDEKTLERLRAPLRSVRAFVHGFALLELSGQFMNKDDLDRSFEFGLLSLLDRIERVVPNASGIRLRAGHTRRKLR